MRLLLDTQLLLWAVSQSGRLSSTARQLIGDPDNELCFSIASIWEVAIKHGRGRQEFQADPRLLRSGLLNNLYHELPVTGEHAVAIASLPPLHRDPFDRMLVAQAKVEGLTLMTRDADIRRYDVPVLSF
jgi:PIN domain nuclease of toxin-antitoxin system